MVSTIVSSTLLAKIAAAAGVRYEETLTGFKWIATRGDGVPGARFVFGYEEALGYTVGDVVRDKDGVGAALGCAGWRRRRKRRRWKTSYEDIERRYGLHVSGQVNVVRKGTTGQRIAAGDGPPDARPRAEARPLRGCLEG